MIVAVWRVTDKHPPAVRAFPDVARVDGAPSPALASDIRG